MSRGDFLRLAGFAGAGMALPGSLAMFGEAEAAEILGGEFPIGIWWPPPPEETTVERYREIADAGFNFVIGGNMVGDESVEETPDTKNAKSLEMASANGLRFILHDPSLRRIIVGASSGMRSFASGSESESPMRELRDDGGGEDREFSASSSSDSSGEIRQRIAELLDTHGDSPALAGINLFDEPHTRNFTNVAHAKKAMENLDASLLPYVNVWPSHTSSAAMGAPNYPTYLSRYMNEIDPKVLSFDHYPLLAGRSHTRDYFYNWEVIRRNAISAGVPSWVFIQSVDFDGRDVGLAYRRRPSRADLLWQVNVSLAYGAKGIQYFTYWTPEGTPSEYGQALISKAGTRTPTYDHARSVNAYLSIIGRALAPMRSVGVVFTGRPPSGTKRFRRDAFVSSVGGSPVAVGSSRRPGTSAKVRFLFIVNRSSFARSSSLFAMNPNVESISRFIPARKRFVPVRRRKNERGARKLRVTLAPGAAQLIMLRKR